MPVRHLDPEVFDRLLRGEVDAADVRDLALHLMEACPDCARAVEIGWALSAHASDMEEEGSQLFPRSAPGPRSPESPSRAAAFDRAIDDLGTRARDLLRVVRVEREEAPKLVAELLEQPAAHRRLLVMNNLRLQTLPILEALLEHAWKTGFESPAVAESTVELALELADCLDADRYGREVIEDLRGRSWALRGNFRRISGDLRGAEAAFASARERLALGTGDLLERARLLTLESTLKRQQARRETASELLDEAIKIYELLDETHLVGRTLINQALLLHEQGDVEDAVRTLRKAQTLVEPGREPHLVRVMQQNLVGYLSEMGRYEEAMRLIPALRHQMVQHGSRTELLRLRWQEGKIHLGLGNEARAEAALIEVRRGFMEQDLNYDVASVSLELAAMYMRQRRTTEIRELAAQMFPIFQSRDLHQQAIAALLLFQRAVQMDTLTLRMVEEVADVVRRSQERPRPQTPEPS